MIASRKQCARSDGSGEDLEAVCFLLEPRERLGLRYALLGFGPSDVASQ